MDKKWSRGSIALCLTLLVGAYPASLGIVWGVNSGGELLSRTYSATQNHLILSLIKSKLKGRDISVSFDKKGNVKGPENLSESELYSALFVALTKEDQCRLTVDLIRDTLSDDESSTPIKTVSPS